MEPPAGASGAEQLAGSPAAALSAAKEAGHQASTRGAAQQGSRLKRGRSDPLPETHGPGTTAAGRRHVGLKS